MHLYRIEDKTNPREFYQTPYSMVWQLLEKEHIHGRILEPSCGSGAVSKVLLEKCNCTVESQDLIYGQNFLEKEEDTRYDLVITNPPFKLSTDFIVKSMKIADKCIMLLPLNYLQGLDRYKRIFSNKDFSLTKLYAFTRYPWLTQELYEDGKYGTGMIAYGWFIFEKGQHETKLGFIDNSKYLLLKKELKERSQER